MFDYSYKLLGKRLGLLLVFYQFFRTAFFFLNQDTFEDITAQQVALAFLHGLRFDASALVLVNIPFIFLSVAPGKVIQENLAYQKWLMVLYATLNIPFFFLNLIDIEYYKFIGRRTTNELFIITQDIMDQAGHLFIDYWYFVAFGLLLGFLLIKMYPRYRPPRFSYYPLSLRILSFVFLVLVCIILIRGGTQYKPLRINHAFVHEPPALGNVALNSTFTFMRSINNTALEKKFYFKSQEDIARHLGFDPYYYLRVNEPPVRDNVVILILESFASEYIGIENNGRGFTPFFDSLATQGTLFRENYANGKRSILALPSILAGLPSLMEDPFISSSYEANQIFGLGSILKPAGYTTSFFHGAANGTMGFNAFTEQIDIDKYYGLDEYPANLKERDYDGLWGIFDEPYLQYVCQQLTQQPQPFASTIFTLSSHDPYKIPDQYQGRFPKGKIAILESIGYTDYALREFFKAAAKQPWYPNTLFILTGDHTQKSIGREYKNSVAMHKVPLVLFHPSKSFAFADTRQITQHADILPTIVDYLNIPTDKLLPFGRSVLDNSRKGRALYYLGDAYTLLHQDYITRLLSNEKVNLYRYRTHSYQPLKHPVPDVQELYSKDLKAYVQYFRNGMVDNNLYYWIEDKQLGRNQGKTTSSR